jgi:hypothetical protein
MKNITLSAAGKSDRASAAGSAGTAQDPERSLPPVAGAGMRHRRVEALLGMR